MATHYIPRSFKGETRILIIFTTKSLIYTGIGALVGLIFYFIFGVILGIKPLGIGLMAFVALIGYLIATIKVPYIPGIRITKDMAGDTVDELIRRYIKFSNNKRKYTYVSTKEEK